MRETERSARVAKSDWMTARDSRGMTTDRKKARVEKHERSAVKCRAAGREGWRFCDWRGSPGSPPGFWGDANYRQGDLGRAEGPRRSDSRASEGGRVGN